MTHLKNKIALVIGGSRGIGTAIVKRLAADGAHVAFTYSQSQTKAEELAAEITAGGGKALALKADNRDAAAVRAAVDQTAETYGRIDILVNSAGIFNVGTISDLTLDAFDQAIDVNVRAVFVATNAAVAHMPNGGRIITIGTNLSARVSVPGIGLYVMSKSALIGLTKSIARDLGARDITANIVHPGSTDTDMNPADVAAMVAWLASPESRNITGAEFTIDSGTNA